MNVTIPILDSSDDSLELIKVLSKLGKKGNKKATEVLSYLMNRPEYLNMEHFKHHKIVPSNAHDNRYDLYWSDFRINDNFKDDIHIEFEVTILTEDEKREHLLGALLSDYHHRSFRQEFLEKEVALWLRQNGYQLRKSNQAENKGRMYGKMTHAFHESKPHPDHDHLRITRRASAKCSFQIVPLGKN